MNVDAKSGVVGKIPTWIVRVLVDYDWVRVPNPAGHIREVDGRYTPVPVVEPKPVRATTRQMPLMSWTEPSRIVAVLPGVIQVEA